MPDGSVTVRFARQAGSSDDITPRGKFQCRMTHGVRFIAGEAARPLPLRMRMETPVQAPIQNGDADIPQPRGSSRSWPIRLPESSSGYAAASDRVLH